MKPEVWVSLSEIAEHLQVSTDTVHRVDSGEEDSGPPSGPVLEVPSVGN